MSVRILCVDPDETARAETVSTLQEELDHLDPVFERVDGLGGARHEFEDGSVECVITEQILPDGSGFELISEIKNHHPDAGCILFTDADPETFDTSALTGSITEYVGKDSVFGRQRLAQLVRTTVEMRAQASYPLPQNESERLAALQTYNLDTPALASSLDRISDLAAQHFGVEIASINIINEHSQEFLACYGRTEEWETMDREDSICTFTILEDEIMAVEDVTTDPRFESRSQAMLELGIQSYLGANLTTANGLNIGPLCIYDDEPRSFSPEDKTFLTDLASVATDLIELHSKLESAESTGGEQ